MQKINNIERSNSLELAVRNKVRLNHENSDTSEALQPNPLRTSHDVINTTTNNDITITKLALAGNFDVQKYEVTYPEGGYYSGQLNLDNKKHGYGTYIWPDGSKYVGEWKDDVKDGYGVYTDQDGRHEGNWCKDLRHGQGTFTSTSGIEFRGMWNKDELSHNHSVTIKYLDGHTYVGKTITNEEGIPLKHGKGRYTWPDGTYYEGEWINNLQHGEGEFVDQNGIKYLGRWNNGKINQEHTFIIVHENLDRYQGPIDEFFDKKGLGIYTWNDTGITYKGYWENDTMHGYGIMLNNANEPLYEGYWENGKLIEIFPISKK